MCIEGINGTNGAVGPMGFNGSVSRTEDPGTPGRWGLPGIRGCRGSHWFSWVGGDRLKEWNRWLTRKSGKHDSGSIDIHGFKGFFFKFIITVLSEGRSKAVLSSLWVKTLFMNG